MTGRWGFRLNRTHLTEIPVPCDRFFDFGYLFIEKTARSSDSCDGSRQAVSNTAIESFWRCIFVEIWLLLWSIRGHWRFPGIPRASPGVLREVPGGSQGRSQGFPIASPGVPRALWMSQASPGSFSYR